VPDGHVELVVHAVVEVQIPAEHVGAPAGHCALFVHVDALKIAGVAVHDAEVPVAVKFPLLSANAPIPAHIRVTAAVAKTGASFLMMSSCLLSGDGEFRRSD
jgi:hypothetical protein